MIRKVPILIALIVFGIAFCGRKTDNAQIENKGEQIRAALTFINGKVFVERNGERQVAKAGFFLQQSDVVLTEEKSSAELALQRYGAVKLGEKTRVQITALIKSATESSVELKLDAGDLASFVTKRNNSSNYSVITPTAIAGVRGTQFLTSVERLQPGSKKKNPRVMVGVLTGTVAVNLPGQKEVILPENTQLIIDGFERLTNEMIRTLSPESLKTIKSLAVFHKSEILEFNAMLEQVRASSGAARSLEGGEVDKGIGARDRKIGQTHLSGDSVTEASRANAGKHLKRDVNSEHIKLKPESGYKE